MTRTAAVLIIGNEILTGKIQDQNLGYLAAELFQLGVRLRRAVVCADEIETIVSELNALRVAHDVVFTSGGVGPTHDDLTLRCTEAHLRMADVPEGARLLNNAEVPWPTVVVENVYVFPGVPEIFRMKFPVVREHLRGNVRFHSRAVYTHCEEGEVAALLSRLAEAHPEVSIGSYPRFRDPDHRLKVTFDGVDEGAIARALEAFVQALPAEVVVRVE
jgi:molybdenum cofactor synthesis domain-containing protein